MHKHPRLAHVGFALFTIVVCLGCRPECDTREGTLTCADMDITVLPGTCVDITNPCCIDPCCDDPEPCDASGDWHRPDGFRLCDEPLLIFVRTRRGPSGTTREVCADDGVALFTNVPATFIYAVSGE